MNVIDFLFSAYYEVATEYIILEAIAVVFGIASVVYSRLEHIWVYPTGLISTGIYTFLLLRAGLYGDMGINAYYFGMSIYGWYNWSRPREAGNVLPITRANTKEHLIGIGILVASFFVLYYLLSNFTDSTVPIIDAFTTSIFFVGMWYMAQKKLVNWIYWIIADIISIPLYFYKELPLSSIQFIVFTVLAIMGYLEWRRRLEKNASEKLITDIGTS